MSGSTVMLVRARNGQPYYVEAGVLKAAANALAVTEPEIRKLRADAAATKALEYLLARQPLNPAIRKAV
jgi:hypothetical protein